jgi:nitrite reductase/ring-hydroxylating ferredoxin subunit
MGEWRPLCRLDEIEDGTAKGFEIGSDARVRLFLVVRQGTQVFAYENSCPHTGATLDWQPDIFLTVERDLIQCATHGALFRIEDGRCVHGPCVGASLERIDARVKDNLILSAL